jgi:ABC-type transport system substrate-binding protein
VIGSGPFMFTNIQPDVAYSYKKNPDWHLKPQAYVDTLKIAIIPAVPQQLAQFAAGQLDELQIQNPNDVQTVQQQNPKASFYRVAYGGPNPLYFQMGDPASPFRDLRVRQAISMAIDRDAISKAIYNGQSQQVVFMPAYLGKWALPVQNLDPSVQQYYKYNATEAKKLLAAAGQSNLQIRLVNPFASLGSPATANAVEVINSTFNTLGIKSSIVNGDYNKDFVDAGKGWRQGYYDSDMVIYGQGPPYDEADEDLFSYFDSKSTEPQERLNDPTLDAMITKERAVVNDDERVQAVFAIQKYLAQQLYAPSTVGQYYNWATQPRVQNYCYSNTNGKATETYAKIWLKA